MDIVIFVIFFFGDLSFWGGFEGCSLSLRRVGEGDHDGYWEMKGLFTEG